MMLYNSLRDFVNDYRNATIEKMQIRIINHK